MARMAASRMALVILSSSLPSLPLGASLPAGLEPAEVWHHFGKIMAIPRCSGEEAAVAAYVRDFAAQHGLSAVEDKARNLIVKRPASGASAARAKADPVIIQTHLDMVCEKNSGYDHDWTHHPILADFRDGWLIADNTTLGADNGVGVAIALALMGMDREEVAPPLEFVFTVEEETGLFGAEGLEVDLLSGRSLLNFDSEEYGYIYIGSAGGGDATVVLPVLSEAVPLAMEPFRLDLTGLRGGHSGADIHEYRGNALLLLARAIAELQHEMPEIRLLDFAGGDKDNAIPREAGAVIGLASAEGRAAVVSALADIEARLKLEFGRIDPGLTLRLALQPMEAAPAHSLDDDSGRRLLDLLHLLPHGPLKKSHETPGFMVETSNNVARVRREGPGQLAVLCFARSSVDSALEAVQHKISRAARVAGGSVERGPTFPGWAPNASQVLLGVAVEEFAQVMGSRPEVLAIHAGLECGLIGAKIPGIEMISFGPDIVGAHAPGERVKVESVQGTWVATRQLLKGLAGLVSEEL